MRLGRNNRKNPGSFGKKMDKGGLLSVDELVLGVMNTFHQVLRANVYETGYSKAEIEERIESKRILRQALRNCAFGDRASKSYVKDYIKEILVQKYGISPHTIDQVLPFGSAEKQSVQDKFDIMLHQTKKEHGKDALGYLIEEYHLDLPKALTSEQSYYEVTEEDLQQIYEGFPVHGLTFIDKLNILTQRIYQEYKGNGVIDEIRDMRIDGVSAGVSGLLSDGEDMDNLALPAGCRAHESIWIFYKGKSIHLSFLGFRNEKELIRVCKNIYRYQSQRQLSESTGYIVNEMMDGSRISVARPPFAESWVLFVRKFDSVLQADMDRLLTDEGKELPIELIRWLIRSCQVTGVTGEQGAGKTTLLISMIGFIHPSFNLRIQELSAELHLRKIYPKRNIVSFRETASTSGQEGLDFQKKTDGTVSILGEVATAPVANWLVQMAMVASRFTLFTHHAKTTHNLVTALRNSLLLEGGFQNERVAEEQVVDAIHFDIHMNRSLDGHRYIERITEIIAVSERKQGQAESSDMGQTVFLTRDLVSYKDGKYVCQNTLSQAGTARMMAQLSQDEREQFYQEGVKWGWLDHAEEIPGTAV